MVDTTNNAAATGPVAAAPLASDYAPAAPAAAAPAANPYAALIEGWKGRYKSVMQITVKDDTGAESLCFHHNPDRNVIGQALTLVMSKKVMEAGEMVLMNTWLGGDERCNPNNPGADDTMVVAASMAAAGNIELYSASSKKL
jgi:hypothetical protein